MDEFAVKAGAKVRFSCNGWMSLRHPGLYIKVLSVGDFREGLAPVEVDKEWGFIDQKGRMTVAPKFPWLDHFSEGLAIYRDNSKVGYFGPAPAPHSLQGIWISCRVSMPRGGNFF